MSLDDELKRAAARAAEEVAQPLHLSQRELLDFVGGELEEFELHRVRSHLLSCRSCLEEYRAVQSFLDPEQKADPKKLGTLWADFQQRQTGPDPSQKPGILTWVKESAVVPGPAAFAAVLLAFAAGLAVMYPWIPSEGVRTNPLIIELTARSSPVRSVQSQQDAVSYPHQEPLTLILVDPLSNETVIVDEFEYEIVTLDGESVFAGKGLQRTDQGNFSIRLRAGYLDPGRYRIFLRVPSKPDVLAEYQLALQ